MNPLPGLAERPQRGLPEHLARADFADLAKLLRHADQGAWAFGLYNTVAIRDEVVDALRVLLAPLPVLDFTLSPDRPDPLACLQDLPAGERAILFFYDIEYAGAGALNALEYQREWFAAHPHGLVFWVTPAGQVRVARGAPNFWAQRSGVFDFLILQPQALAQTRADWANAPIQIQSPEDWERQMRLFGGLLAEYEQEVEPSPARLAELHGKLAYLLFRRYRHAEALEHLQAQLHVARSSGDRRAEAQALLNMGQVQAFLDQHGEARARYEEALPIYRAIGDRPGEANTIRALGDVALEAEDLERAQQAYEDARDRYRGLGLPDDEAGALNRMADLFERQKQYNRAISGKDEIEQLLQSWLAGKTP
ncbi:MAG: tetratricopeptide repeat protein [Chloroflexi bacterium]|nr:tetratricopeptide repeat protein [Chloroflexota bacterium]